MKAAKRIVFVTIFMCICYEFGMWISRRVALEPREVYLAEVRVLNILLAFVCGFLFWLMLTRNNEKETKGE